MAYAIEPRTAYAKQFKAPGFNSNFSKEEAFVTILTAAVHADQNMRRVEEQELLALVGRTRTLHATGHEERKRLMEDAAEALRDPMRFQHTVENACAKLREIDVEKSDSEGICASAYAHACDIVHADLEVHTKEVQFLQYLRKKLLINDDLADRIQNDLILKNAY